jgi:hypothetical protein
MNILLRRRLDSWFYLDDPLHHFPTEQKVKDKAARDDPFQHLLAKSKVLGSELEYPYILSTFESVPGFWTCSKTQTSLDCVALQVSWYPRRTKLLHTVRWSKHFWCITPFTVYSNRMKQFVGAMSTNLNETNWSAWAPPKCKFFCWLTVQEGIWTADKLRARGWPHNSVCPLRRRDSKTGKHLFSECRFTRRIWADLSAWLAESWLQPTNWEDTTSVYEWWSAIARMQGVSRKELKSLIILVCWEVWNERNAHIFNHRETPSFVVSAKIKDEASSWILAGTKHLACLLGRVWAFLRVLTILATVSNLPVKYCNI